MLPADTSKFICLLVVGEETASTKCSIKSESSIKSSRTSESEITKCKLKIDYI